MIPRIPTFVNMKSKKSAFKINIKNPQRRSIFAPAVLLRFYAAAAPLKNQYRIAKSVEQRSVICKFLAADIGKFLKQVVYRQSLLLLAANAVNDTSLVHHY